MNARRMYWVYLRDIREAAARARRHVSGTSYDEFVRNEMAVDACLRTLEIIGEATRRLPEEVRALDPEIPWRQMIALRNVVAHEYDRINLPVVWKTIQRDLPGIESRLARIEAIQRQREESQPG